MYLYTVHVAVQCYFWDLFLCSLMFLIICCLKKAQELRSYLRDNGANIKEETITPLHDELEELINACNMCFKTEAGTGGSLHLIS